MENKINQNEQNIENKKENEQNNDNNIQKENNENNNNKEITNLDEKIENKDNTNNQSYIPVNINTNIGTNENIEKENENIIIKNNIKEKNTKEENKEEIKEKNTKEENKEEIKEINTKDENKEETKEINTKEENKEEENEINPEENIFVNITEDEGIQKKILKKGKGATPKEGNEVEIYYIGKYEDKIFEQTNENETFTFIIGENKVIKGWDIAVKTMQLGEKSEYIMKPEYTYGDKPVNENIPPNSILTYEIELKSIHYKCAEDCIHNLTYSEKLQWGKLLKQEGVNKFKENNISGAKEDFIKALSFLNTMNPEKEEEKEGVELLLTILANICNCVNKEKDYDSVIKYATIGINIKKTPKLLYFRTIAFAYKEEFKLAENDLNELIELFKSSGDENNEEVNNTINYLRTLIDSRIKIYEEKNKIFSRAIYRQVLYNNKTNNNKILVPNQVPNPNNPVVFFEIQVEKENIGKIEFELFKDVVPITTENFRNLCIGTQNGLTYKNSCVNKIIKNFVLGGGNLENYNGGDKCIYGEYFDDENYTYCHCRRGLLTMDNDGKNKNNSKFLITLKYIPWFDGKHVVFGQIIKGMEILDQIENIETDENDKPLKKITIINCGEIIRENIESNIDTKDNKIEDKKIIENNNEGNNIIEEKKDENNEQKDGNKNKEIREDINKINKDALDKESSINTTQENKININVENTHDNKITGKNQEQNDLSQEKQN
jgi:cyclophilin family peptidyl-prolyl cis-trans isomerase/FKBP-type peptidyl-prolyl cis-trans isomerase